MQAQKKQQKQDEVIKVEIPEIMKTLIRQLHYKAAAKASVLQREENGNKIANLQGFLAGVRSYKETLKLSSYILSDEFRGIEKQETPYFEDKNCLIGLLKLREVVYEIDEMTSSFEFETFKELFNDVVNDKKDKLFYSSKKGRDLHLVKGWYEAMKWVDDTIKLLRIELATEEKKAAESLPFDDGE